MADGIVPYGHDDEAVKEYVEKWRRGHGIEWTADKLSIARGVEVIHVSEQDGQATLVINGSDMTEIRDWTAGLRLIDAYLKQLGIDVVYGGAVFVPGLTEHGVPVDLIRTIEEILQSGENGIIIGNLSVELFRVGRPLPPGLVPRLLNAAEAMTNNVGEQKEADPSAEGNPLGTLPFA